jgi:hypothetical protein
MFIALESFSTSHALERWMLLEYVSMTAIAVIKILKKYDKVCTRLVNIC